MTYRRLFEELRKFEKWSYSKVFIAVEWVGLQDYVIKMHKNSYGRLSRGLINIAKSELRNMSVTSLRKKLCDTATEISQSPWLFASPGIPTRARVLSCAESTDPSSTCNEPISTPTVRMTFGSIVDAMSQQFGESAWYEAERATYAEQQMRRAQEMLQCSTSIGTSSTTLSPTTLSQAAEQLNSGVSDRVRRYLASQEDTWALPDGTYRYFYRNDPSSE